MRKVDREIKDFNEIIDVINNLETIRIGINNDQYPYVVPVSFGYEVIDQQLVFYFHGAKAGMKYDLIKKNPHVCVEGDICYRFKDTISSVTCLYESIIAFGKCELVDDDQEVIKGLKLLLSHCGYDNHFIDDKAAKYTALYKVTVTAITGKRRF